VFLAFSLECRFGPFWPVFSSCSPTEFYFGRTYLLSCRCVPDSTSQHVLNPLERGVWRACSLGYRHGRLLVLYRYVIFRLAYAQLPAHSLLNTILYPCFLQYYTVQYSTVQYSTVQYSTVQYSTVQYSTVQYSTVQGHPAIRITVHVLRLTR
jgi:hypothetical protein